MKMSHLSGGGGGCSCGSGTGNASSLKPTIPIHLGDTSDKGDLWKEKQPATDTSCTSEVAHIFVPSALMSCCSRFFLPLAIASSNLAHTSADGRRGGR